MNEKMNIFEAISAVMKDCGAVGKTSTNPQQGYKYRGIDAVMNAIQPALVKHGVFVTPEVLEQTREERQTTRGGNLIYSVVKVKYTFYSNDGSSVSAVVVGEGMDSGDKATNKAMSAAFKYALFQTFCIPTEEMVDSETESPEVAPKMPVPSEIESVKRIVSMAGYDPMKLQSSSGRPVMWDKLNSVELENIRRWAMSQVKGGAMNG